MSRIFIKKTSGQWKKEILTSARKLFLSKEYEETSVSDIMELADGDKRYILPFLQRKEDLIYALRDQMFLENNPFEAGRERYGLNELQKIMRGNAIVNQIASLSYY